MNISKLDEKRKKAILNSALKEFTTKGYDEASTNVIAKEAEISKALMFHYVINKQELFLYVYNYFEKIMEEEYYTKIDLKEKDLFNRLRQNYILQLDLIIQYSCILNVDKLTVKTHSDEINKRIQNSKNKRKESICSQLFNNIDISRFRKDLDIEKTKQFILWSNVGFTNQILDDIRSERNQGSNKEYIILMLDSYLDELRKIFYVSSEESKR